MKSDLETLIDYYQNEEYAQTVELEACVANWNFEGAIRFRNSIYKIRIVLQNLKSFKDSNYLEKEKLEGTIQRLRKSLDREGMYIDLGNEELSKRLKESWDKNTRRRIDQKLDSLIELKNMKSINSTDDDTILEILDELQTERLTKMEIEFVVDEIYLDVIVAKDVGDFMFRCVGSKSIELLFYPQTKSVLMRLGYDKVHFSKRIENYKNANKAKILEELAVINFEAFSYRRDKILKIKVE